MDHIWIVACAAGALLARVGLALYNCGLVRAKNAGGSLLRHVADLCLTTLSFWAIGIAVLNPGNSHTGTIHHYLFGLQPSDTASFAPGVFLILVATLLASGIVVGALSERSRFWPSLMPSILLGAVLIPLFVNGSRPDGFLDRHHFHDFAGAGFIHLAAGLCAAVGTLAVGPRNGKYNRDGSSNVIPGHSLPLACGGVLLMMIAWFPYLLGFAVLSAESAGGVALNAMLAVAAAGLASLAVAHFRYGKPDIYLTFSGILGGLVAISAGADVMSNLTAVITGAIAGILIPTLLLQADLIWRMDDPTGALVIHGFGGLWGLIAVGLFAPLSPSSSRIRALVAQFTGIAVIAGITLLASSVLFIILKNASLLRARESDEFDGLDLAEHDIGSYPDFQQTTIKSYHLREA
jgi:Amt family ammonium transporter